jgi:hypothetical protein
MAELLHEYWEGDDGGEFYVVRERNDQLRPSLTPNSRLVFSVRACSWHEAMQLQYDRLGYGIYDPAGVENYIYSDEEAAEQEEYLQRRKGS